jgi:hypothetical protein
LGEAEVPGLKSLLNVQLDIEHFYKDSFPFFYEIKNGTMKERTVACLPSPPSYAYRDKDILP